MSPHTLVLLGDSILDNASYTRPEPDTTEHLQRLLAPHWSVTRLARDGAGMRDVPFQLSKLKENSTAAVLSIGGNDATVHIGVLDRRVSTAAEVLEELLNITQEFGRRYESVARAVAEHATRTVLCTIYEVQLRPARYARLARVPLALLNETIIRTGARLGLDVLELRSVCTEPSDFVMQIEPSPHGAAKIAKAIAALLLDPTLLNVGRVFVAQERREADMK